MGSFSAIPAANQAMTGRPGRGSEGRAVGRVRVLLLPARQVEGVESRRMKAESARVSVSAGPRVRARGLVPATGARRRPLLGHGQTQVFASTFQRF